MTNETKHPYSKTVGYYTSGGRGQLAYFNVLSALKDRLKKHGPISTAEAYLVSKSGYSYPVLSMVFKAIMDDMIEAGTAAKVKSGVYVILRPGEVFNTLNYPGLNRGYTKQMVTESDFEPIQLPELQPRQTIKPWFSKVYKQTMSV